MNINSWSRWFRVMVILLSSKQSYGMESIIQQKLFIPGKTSLGHHQIEASCESCHTPFLGVKSESCIECHADLKAYDSHPPKKFRDPRNAALLQKIAATNCITCHGEHGRMQTDKVGVTIPGDYCQICHSEIGVDRKTHKGLEYSTCRDCHNYHDNRDLYEEFLARHLDEPDVKPRQAVLRKTRRKTNRVPEGVEISYSLEVLSEWQHSYHAEKGVDCKDCHKKQDSSEWINSPGEGACKDCHSVQWAGFARGRHGMRSLIGQKPVGVSEAEIAMKSTAHQRELSCHSCHGAHEYSLEKAGIRACDSCHDDQHSQSFTKSVHFTAEKMTCATCHMPKMEDKEGKVYTNHNQNYNLRPNSKMIRSVCLTCHGMEFTLDALFDKELIRNNFSSRPRKSLPSLQWVKERQR